MLIRDRNLDKKWVEINEENMTLPEPPRHVNTTHGHVRVLVLTWLQYIALRIKRHGIKYIFNKTSAGYPRILSLGYYSRSHGEIVLAKVGDYKMRYLHEEGHANGKEHVWIDGDIMHPHGFKRGPYTHTCTYPVESFEECNKNKIKTEWCTRCMFLRK